MVSPFRRAARSAARSVLGEETFSRALQVMNDQRMRPRIGKVRFGDLRRTAPICREYGFERGRPIDRYYIEKFLAANGHLITGAVLEVGERTYTQAFGQGVTQSDMLHVADEEGATYVADLVDAPHVPSNTYDCVILTQTLQMIFDMKAALQTVYRILKPGGVLICTAPGITQISDPVWNSTWYWSLTELAANRLFRTVFPPNNVDVRAFGNVLSTTAFLYGLADRELRRQELEVFDPEYPLIVTIVARKGDIGTRQHRLSAAKAPTGSGSSDDTSYRLATEFLTGEGGTVEEWNATIDKDLQDHTSNVDHLLVHHVLEHHWGWRRVLTNAVSSFDRRMALVISTPLGESEMRLDRERPVPDLQLPREELLGFLKGLTVREEIVASQSDGGTETIFYVER